MDRDRGNSEFIQIMGGFKSILGEQDVPRAAIFRHKASDNFRVNEWQLKLSVDAFSEVKLNVGSKYLVCWT